MNPFSRMLTVAGLAFLAAAAPVRADGLVIPHNPGDRIIIHTYPDNYAHPVDYWWHQYGDVSEAEWDYFSEVKRFDEPIQLNPVRRTMDSLSVSRGQPTAVRRAASQGYSPVPR